jgi:Short C-terminal domain
MFRRRRPLLRAAMVGGGAYIAGKKVQQGREQDADQHQDPEGAPAPPASGGISDQTIEQLQKLGDLRKQGVLTEEEFEQQKQKLLQPA